MEGTSESIRKDNMRERNKPKKFRCKITMKLMKLKLQNLSLALHPSALERDLEMYSLHHTSNFQIFFISNWLRMLSFSLPIASFIYFPIL